MVSRSMRLAVAVALLAFHAPLATAQLAPTAEERAEGFIALFDGTSTAAWRGYWSEAMPEGWHIVDGVLTKSTAIGDILTREMYSDFELRLDWKLGRGGNAGIFYHGTEAYPKVYWSGPEYQLLDDANAADGRSRLTAAGAAYGLYPAPEGVVRPAGEWNTTRIIVRRGHVEHWLNGVKLLEYQLWSTEWREKVAATKFAAWPGYGLSGRGHIAIQGDHAGELSLRNIRIRPG